MVNENTTGSEPTTETPAPANPSPAPTPDTSTTTPEPAPAEEGDTLLTSPEPNEPAKPEQTDEEKAADAARSELFGVPEGDYEVTGLPEGTVIDDKALAAITPVARELGLSSAGLSKIAATYATEVLPGVTEQVVDNLQRDITAKHAEWATAAIESVKTNPVFENKPMAEVKAIAAKALDRFGGAEFRSFLDDTGLGNNPDMIKFAFMAGSAIAEDTTFERGDVAPAKKSITEKFYGPQT